MTAVTADTKKHQHIILWEFLALSSPHSALWRSFSTGSWIWSSTGSQGQAIENYSFAYGEGQQTFFVVFVFGKLYLESVMQQLTMTSLRPWARSPLHQSVQTCKIKIVLLPGCWKALGKSRFYWGANLERGSGYSPPPLRCYFLCSLYTSCLGVRFSSETSQGC